MKKVGCANKFLGNCPKCIYDVDENHHPNNLECPNYRPMGYLLLVLEQPENKLEVKNESVSKTRRNSKPSPSTDILGGDELL